MVEPPAKPVLTPEKRRGPASKVLILGLDGATWDVFEPLMSSGRMPNLRQIVAESASGVLRSTIPPITPAAWTTFMTGQSPGVHGIIDFERYDVRTNRLSFNTTNALQQVRTIWQILGDAGLKVGSINVPMTYPPVPVNGFMISGFEAVSTRADFAFPAVLKAEILAGWPQYLFKNKWRNQWRRKVFGGFGQYRDNLRDITESFTQGAEVVEFCGEKYGWDVLMVVFKMVDNLQHKVWRYIDPRTRDRYPRFCRAAEDCFAELDVTIGRVMAYARRHRAHVVIVSDHGHGSLEGKAQPNLMLKHWGYLHLREGGAQARTRGRHSLGRLLRRKGKFAAGNFSLEEDLAVDFSRTQAAVMHAGMAGFLYLNLRGRQETGIVDPARYEALRDELKARFEGVTSVDPTGRTVRVFEAVHRPEELYGCERGEREWLPDLLLCPTPALAVVRKIRGRSEVQWVALRRMEGTHRREGVFAVHGPGVAAGKRLDADIIDATPTILAMLGLPVPGNMEGRVIEGAFDPPLAYTKEAARAAAPAAAAAPTGEVYSAEDMALLTQRLADLGYLE